MKRAYADIPEGQIHYRTEGDGEPVLLLHMASSSSDEYTRMIPFLSKTYRAIAMDLLGYGESDKPPYAYQIIDHARTVVSFMDALGIEKASIVGQHSGATIGAELAVTWPDRVDKLVLSSYPYFRDASVWIEEKSNPNFSRVEISADGLHLMEWWRRASRHGDRVEIVEERALDFHKAGPRAEELHWALFAYGPEAEARLPLVKCATLLLSGTKDFLCPATEDVNKLIARSKVMIIKNGPININRVMPREVAEPILAFLENPGV